jgi:hypothetical protein
MWRNACVADEPAAQLPCRSPSAIITAGHKGRSCVQSIKSVEKIGLLVAAVLLATLSVWLGPEAITVHKRRAFLADVVASGGDWESHESYQLPSHIFSIREFFGDTSVGAIIFPSKAGQAELDRAKELFPEAAVSQSMNGGFF